MSASFDAASLTPRLDLLLRRLTSLAGDARDLLASGDWESAAPLQDEYDAEFAALTRLVDTGHAFSSEHASALATLRTVNDENLRLTRELHATAGRELADARQRRHVGSSYSPLGAHHRPSPRYVDGAA